MLRRLRATWQTLRRRPWLGLLAAASLLLLGGGGAWAARQLWAEYHLRAARQALRHWDFKTARGHLALCLQVWHDRPDVCFLAARTARRAGFYDDADRLLADCQRLQGRTPETVLEWAMVRVQSGDFAGSAAFLVERVKQDDPDTPLILEALALGYNEVYDLHSAAACLSQLLERQPDNAYALLWHGRVLSGMSYFARAREDYQRAVEVDPEYDDARLALAQNLLDHALKPDEAVGHLELLRRRQPRNLEVLLALARCYRQLGRTDEARALLDALLREHPDDARALAERGRLALAEQHEAEAEDWLKKSLQADPHAREHLYLLYECLSRQGKADEAAECLARFRRIEDDLKQLEKAINEVGHTPQDPEPRYRAGIICLRNGQDREGLRWLYGALEQAPQHRATHAALAEYYERIGDREQAAEHRRFAGP
jgi:tetratricopeptide (TPR) repeat protein